MRLLSSLVLLLSLFLSGCAFSGSSPDGYRLAETEIDCAQLILLRDELELFNKSDGVYFVVDMRGARHNADENANGHYYGYVKKEGRPGYWSPVCADVYFIKVNKGKVVERRLLGDVSYDAYYQRGGA